MNRFRIRVILLVIALLGIQMPAHKASALINNMFFIDPILVSNSVDIDGNFEVSVTIKSNFLLLGLTVDFSYNSQILELTEMNCTDTFSQCDIADNRIIASSIEGVNGEETIATLKFQITDPNYQDDSDFIAFSIDNAKGANDTSALIGEPLVIWQKETRPDNDPENNKEEYQSAAELDSAPDTGGTSSNRNDAQDIIPTFCVAVLSAATLLHFVVKRLMRKKSTGIFK